MLMSPHDHAVDHRVLVVCIGRQALEHFLPHPGLGPPAEAGVYLDPTAEPLGQIAPWDASTIAVQHSLDKQPIVLSGHAPHADPPLHLNHN